MPTFTPMTPRSLLPAQGQGAENALIDFKKGIAGLEFENAKDVAAFANSLGGTLLIGVEEDGADRALQYLPFSAVDVSQLEERVARAIENRCRPKPLVDYARIPFDSGFILAINVWPSIAAPIGVHIRGDRADGFAGRAYAFPLRLANHTVWLDSGDLPMHMLPELRRTLILLSSIPPGEPVAIVRRGHKVNVFTIRSIDEATNTLTLSGLAKQETCIPLDAVKHVYKGTPDHGAAWHLGVFDWY